MSYRCVDLLMPAQLPDVDFARIRPYGDPASRSSAFEELSSILIEQGIIDWPDGVRFFRFGNPDGGREGKGILPSGEVWAWQAKYLFEFDASAAAQITKSLRRTLDLEPTLTRYVIALPIDLPAGDTGDRTSAQTRWDQKVAEWTALAGEHGLAVEFEFVGAHQLLTALTESRHAGRIRYWFGTELLAREWQARRLEETIAKAGRRYTPRLHVEVETARTLDGLDRDERFVRRWKDNLASLRQSREWPWRPPSGLERFFDEALAEARDTLDKTDAALAATVAAVIGTDEPPMIGELLDAAFTAVRRIDDVLHEHCITDGRYFAGEAAYLYARVSDAGSAVRRAKRLAQSAATAACRERMLVLAGRAGVGKTHLLCDFASRRVERGMPTILLLGQDFDARPLLAQIGDLSQIDGTLEDALGVLDAAAEASGTLGVLVIDAINESERPERWADDLRALRVAARRFRRLALVVSCRTEFVSEVIGRDDCPRVTHDGFGEATGAAVRRFTQEFGLEPPTFPVLTPEFNNPLFLKLTCEALATLGASRFPFGAAGLITVCDAFLEAVNRRLAEPSRCDYDERENLVVCVVRELAAVESDHFERADVKRIAEAALPDRSWSRSLMQGLLSEGVLTNLPNDRIAFGYQRLGDVSRASLLADRTWDEVTEWWSRHERELWRYGGVLGALAVIIPEAHGREVLDLAGDHDGRVPYEAIDAFVESLLLRSPASVSARTIDLVRTLLGNDEFQVEIWDRLVRIGCVPAHPLNATWLHRWLSHLEVADRDASWSTWLIGAVGEDSESPVERLLEWAWPQDLSSREPIPDEVGTLATLTLGWFLSTSDRRVRDHATKALVSVAERNCVGFVAGLQQFAGCNDPYVVERIAAAACGFALRTFESPEVIAVASAAHELVVHGWPAHLLTRDYVRRVFSTARTFGWSGPTGEPPYGATWPVDTLSIQAIEAIAGPPKYEYASIWYSLARMGDFGRYVLQPALSKVVTGNEQDLVHAFERAVFGRVLELGWSPERFSSVDAGREGRSDGPVERVGKKYQWIGFYESLGRVADTHDLKHRWSDDPPGPYRYAEQLIWRDLDPTVLARKPTAPPPTPPWFSPTTASFPAESTSDYPSDLAGVPEPLDLIAVTDDEARSWLVLATSPRWEQPTAPEMAALRVPQLETWMQIHAYLVPVVEVPALRSWAVGKDWYGQWMPDHVEPHNLLLGGHPDDPEWAAAHGTVDWWEARSGGPQPVEFVETAAWYGGTGASRDASADEETRGFVPTRVLFDILRLRRGVDFSWFDDAGVAVADPAVVSGGPASLVLRRDLLGLIEEAGYTLFWTVLASRELHRNDWSQPDDEYRWVSASASYVLENGQIAKVDALAGRFRPGPDLEYALHWDSLAREPGR